MNTQQKAKSNFPVFSLGSLVTLKTSFLNEPVGTICYVYEHYGNGGISLITENGEDLGGFNVDEQDEHLEYYADTGKCYVFKNVTQLYTDWRNGVFKPFFTVPKYEKRK